MNSAVVLSVCVAVLQASMALLLLAVSRAPGWGAARTFAFIAVSAAGYSASNISASYSPLSDATRVLGARFSFAMAALHCLGWLLYAFGDSSRSSRMVTRVARVLMVVTVGIGAVCAFSDAHLQPGAFTDLDIAWAKTSYRFATPSALGEAFGVYFALAIGFVYVEFVNRARRSEPGAWVHLVGLGIFLCSVVVEVLVSNGALTFLFVADIGFLACVVPLVGETVQRFIADTRRLNDTSSYLSQEVDYRTRERDEAQGALLEAERHAALGRLAAGVGHEINNPLTYLRLNIELIGEWANANSPSEELRESVDSALDGADRIRRVVDALRAHSQASTGERRVMAPEDLVHSALRMSSHLLRKVSAVETTFETTPTIVGEEPKLVQAVVNLLSNAVQAVSESAHPSAGRIRVHTFTLASGEAAIEVEDSGPGIRPDDLRRLTEPYFTTRSTLGGAGLGLFLSRGIAEQHGGRLEIESGLGKGTLVRIVLPAGALSIAVPVASPRDDTGVDDRTPVLVDF